MKFIKDHLIIFFFVFIGVIIIVLAYIFFQWHLDYDSEKILDAATVGQFGDFIGGFVGTIWALAGVILFYIALTEQRLDFKTNRDAVELQISALNQQISEFELQRKELESSRKIYEEQSKTQKLQQFDSNFYSMLNLFLKIKNNLDKIENNYFQKLYNQVVSVYDDTKTIIENFDLYNNNYITLFNDREYLSQYFKSFYRILKIIDSSPQIKDDSDKIFYAKILRSQLTDYESLILFHNSYSSYGVKSQSLILKYNILKHKPIILSPDFKNFSNILGINHLKSFVETVHKFLTFHINASYEISFVEEKVEEKVDIFNCVFGIYFSDVTKFKIYLDKDISKNNILLEDNDFLSLVKLIIINLTCFNSYINPVKMDIATAKTETDSGKIFSVTITSNEKILLNIDKKI